MTTLEFFSFLHVLITVELPEEAEMHERPFTCANIRQTFPTIQIEEKIGNLHNLHYG